MAGPESRDGSPHREPVEFRRSLRRLEVASSSDPPDVGLPLGGSAGSFGVFLDPSPTPRRPSPTCRADRVVRDLGFMDAVSGRVNLSRSFKGSNPYAALSGSSRLLHTGSAPCRTAVCNVPPHPVVSRGHSPMQPRQAFPCRTSSSPKVQHPSPLCPDVRNPELVGK